MQTQWNILNILIWLALVLCQPCQALCKHKIRMAHAGDYEPYQYTAPGGKLVGFDVDIARGVFDLLGCDIELRRKPNKRAHHALAIGELDLVAAASFTEERHKYAHFSKPYREERATMFVHTARFNAPRTITLAGALDRGLRISAALGGWYGEEYAAQKYRAQELGLLSLNNSSAASFKQLLSGHVDIVIIDRYTGLHYAAKMRLGNVVVDLPHILNDDPVHFMLSRRTISNAQMQKINRAIEIYTASEEYQSLRRKYMLGTP